MGMLSRIPESVHRTLTGRVLVNLLPIAFVLLSSWTVLQQVLVYWVETLIIVIVGMAQLAVTARRSGGQSPGILVVLIGGQILGYTALSWIILAALFKLPLIPYDWVLLGPGDDLLLPRGFVAVKISMLVAIAAYLGTHVHSVVVHLLPQADATRRSLTAVYARPYLRVINGVALIVLIGLVNSFLHHSPAIVLIGFALLKTYIDARSLLVEHRLQR